MSEGYQVRAVFGLQALREKVCAGQAHVHVALIRDGKPMQVEFGVAREALDRIPQDPTAWSAAIEAVTGGPYVDLGRMMVIPLPA